MISIVDNYRGANAREYQDSRSRSPKWGFEEDVLVMVLSELKHKVDSILDAPVGTGRFLEHYSRMGQRVRVTGLDYSDDMLTIAAAHPRAAHAQLLRHDVIHDAIPVAADLVVCYRFLNLIPLEQAKEALGNLATACRKYLLFTIRSVDDAFTGETYIENKLHLHRQSQVTRIVNECGFQIQRRYEFGDTRVGQYAVLFCCRESELVYHIHHPKPVGWFARQIRAVRHRF